MISDLPLFTVSAGGGLVKSFLQESIWCVISNFILCVLGLGFKNFGGLGKGMAMPPRIFLDGSLGVYMPGFVLDRGTERTRYRMPARFPAGLRRIGCLSLVHYSVTVRHGAPASRFMRQ